MSKPVIGQKGVKYGLHVRKPAAAPQAPGPKPSVFGGDSDSEEDTIGAQVQRQAYAKKADTKVRCEGRSQSAAEPRCCARRCAGAAARPARAHAQRPPATAAPR